MSPADLEDRTVADDEEWYRRAVNTLASALLVLDARDEAIAALQGAFDRAIARRRGVVAGPG